MKRKERKGISGMLIDISNLTTKEQLNLFNALKKFAAEKLPSKTIMNIWGLPGNVKRK